MSDEASIRKHTDKLSYGLGDAINAAEKLAGLAVSEDMKERLLEVIEELREIDNELYFALLGRYA